MVFTAYLLPHYEVITCIIHVVVQLNKLFDGELPLSSKIVAGSSRSGSRLGASWSEHYNLV